MAKKALGRGLNALIPQNAPKENAGKSIAGATEIDIEKIIPNKDQPRKSFPQEELQGLADSIKNVGIIEPLVVRKKGANYEIITGERRWRASKIAGLKKIPIIAKNIDDDRILEIALIENIQRQDLNPIEEAMAYKELLEELAIKQDELAKRVGKSRTAVTNSIRLLALPEVIQQHLIDGELSAGHARALLMVKSKAQMGNLAQQAIQKNLSVRELESIAANISDKKTKAKESPNKKSPEIFDLENKLEEALGTRVSIKHGKGGGKIEVTYFDLDDLDRILETIIPE